MNWKPLTLNFRQSYDGGYTYLDNCGKFMSVLREKFGLYATDSKPTGCKLELAEHGIVVLADVNDLQVVHDSPDKNELVLDIIECATALAQDLFNPFEIYRNSYSHRMVSVFASLQKASEACLSKWGGDFERLSKLISLQPTDKTVKYTFSSGSYEFDAKIETVTISVHKRDQTVPNRRTSASRARYMSGINAGSKRSSVEPGYAILLEADLMENSPSREGLTAQYNMLNKLTEILIKDLSS